MNEQILIPSFFNFKKCALIGNASNIKQNEYGNIIDKFENVIRLNVGPTKNYENYVGSRTTHRIISQQAYQNENIQNKFEINFIKNTKNLKILVIAEDNKYELLKNRNQYIDKSINIFFFENLFNKNLRFYVSSKYNIFKKLYYYKYGKNLSVGLVAISILYLLDIEVELFGFDLNKKTDNYGHYYDEEKKIFTNHDFEYENKLLNSIIKSGKIKLNL